MKTDKELLELAARAVGISDEKLHHPVNFWSPLSDDGDSSRLLDKLGEQRNRRGHVVDVVLFQFEDGCSVNVDNQHMSKIKGDDRGACRRRAIVFAAANWQRIKEGSPA